jgi:uncharacterized protein with GYD domain
MAEYYMLGKYSSEAVKGISPDRTRKAVELIEKFSGKVNAAHVLLGGYDLALLVSFPGTPEAMKASLALTKMSGVGFTTLPAMAVEEFDKLTV